MFICVDKCIRMYENIGFFTSLGPCEICGARKECYDIPSKYLNKRIDPELQAYWDEFLDDYMHMAFEIDPDKEQFTDSFDNNIVNVHKSEDCSGKCTIHNHSKHTLSNAPLLWRNDRGIFEHICEHGIGHPCPDSLRNDPGVHGCDLCCNDK